MLALILLGTGAGLIGYAFYKWVTANNDYFETRQMAYLKPTFLLGNLGGMMLKIHQMDDWCKWIYNCQPTAG